MLNAAHSAVKAVDPKMLVVTGGPAPYGDSVNRVRPVRFYRDLLCVQQVKKKKKKRGASKPAFVRTRNCPAPAKFDVLAHNPINTSGGATRSAINPDDASSPTWIGSCVYCARGARRDGSAGSASALGDGELVGQQPAELRAPRWGFRRAGPSRRCIWRGRTAPASSSTC